MFSTKSIRLIQYFCKFVYWVGGIPFVWHVKNGRHLLKVTSSRFKLTHWILVFIYTTYNSVFMAIRLIQAILYMDLTHGQLFINFFSVVTFTTATVLHINTCINATEVPAYFTQAIRLNLRFQSKIITVTAFKLLLKYTFLLLSYRTVYHSQTYQTLQTKSSQVRGN